MHSPQLSAWGAEASFDGIAHILCRLPLKPGTASANSTQGMGITIANLWPSIHLTVGAHCQTIHIDATKTRVPRLYSIKPYIAGSIDTIQYITLTTMAEQGVERMYHNCKTTLFMDEVDGALHAQ